MSLWFGKSQATKIVYSISTSISLSFFLEIEHFLFDRDCNLSVCNSIEILALKKHIIKLMMRDKDESKMMSIWYLGFVMFSFLSENIFVVEVKRLPLDLLLDTHPDLVLV
jgi:hypothetical protein